MAAVGTNIAGVGELQISPLIGEYNLASLVVEVGESIVDLGELLGRKVGDHELASVDGPVHEKGTGLETLLGTAWLGFGRVATRRPAVHLASSMLVLVAMQRRRSMNQRSQG